MMKTSQENFQTKSGPSWGLLPLGLAAFIWGTAFVAQSVGMEHLGPCTFNAVRSFIGGTALLPVAFVISRWKRKRAGAAPKPEGSFWKRNKALITAGGACGVLLGVASLLQQTGIQTVSPGKAGFLTALYIVLVPILGLFAGKRPGWKVWAAAVIAMTGIWFLSVRGDFSIAPGDLLVIASALFFSFHILVIDRFSGRVDGVSLSCAQFFVAGVLSAAAAFLWEVPRWENVLAAWGPLLYTGVLSSGVAYTLQIIGQQSVRPTVASLVLSLESVFAALAGWAVLGEPLSPREIFGCALVFGAVILAQLPEKAGKRALESERL